MHVRRDDLVQVMAGEDAEKRGRILRVMPKDNRVIVEGVNYVQKHVRQSQQNPQGGRVQKEAPIAVSNVMLICQNKNCSKQGNPVRTRTAFDADGRRARVCAACGNEISKPE